MVHCSLEWSHWSFPDHFKCAWMQKHIHTLNTPHDIAHTDKHTPLPQMGYPAVGIYITISELWSFIEMEIPQRWCRIIQYAHISLVLLIHNIAMAINKKHYWHYFDMFCCTLKQRKYKPKWWHNVKSFLSQSNNATGTFPACLYPQQNNWP